MTVSIQANRGYSKRNYAVLRGNPVRAAVKTAERQSTIESISAVVILPRVSE